MLRETSADVFFLAFVLRIYRPGIDSERWPESLDKELRPLDRWEWRLMLTSAKVEYNDIEPAWGDNDVQYERQRMMNRYWWSDAAILGEATATDDCALNAVEYYRCNGACRSYTQTEL